MNPSRTTACDPCLAQYVGGDADLPPRRVLDAFRETVRRGVLHELLPECFAIVVVRGRSFGFEVADKLQQPEPFDRGRVLLGTSHDS